DNAAITASNVLSILRPFVRQLGSRRLCDVTTQHLKDYKVQRLAMPGRRVGTTLAASSLRIEFSWIRSIFRAALRREYIIRNPLDAGFKLPTPKQTVYHIPSREDRERLWAAIKTPVAQDMWRLDSLTGLRGGELRLLRNRYVDPAERQL